MILVTHALLMKQLKLLPCTKSLTESVMSHSLFVLVIVCFEMFHEPRAVRRWALLIIFSIANHYLFLAF
jgi:hypothetical protein